MWWVGGSGGSGVWGTVRRDDVQWYAEGLTCDVALAVRAADRPPLPSVSTYVARP